MSFGDDSPMRSGGPDGELVVELDLEQPRVYAGESVFFTVSLEHTFSAPLSVTSFLDTNRSVKITLKGAGGKTFTADQMSHNERDGISTTEKRKPEGRSLAPGERLELRGDLLEWFGAVKPGQYQVQATYTGIFREARSGPLSLTVLPVVIESAAISRCGGLRNDAPIATALIRRENGACVILSRISSPKVPRNIIHSTVAARLPEQPRSYGAACISGPDPLLGAVYWMEGDSGFSFAVTGFPTGVTGTPVRVDLPFEATPAGSPLLLSDKTLIAIFLCREKDSVALVKAPPAGRPEIHRYVLEGISSADKRTIFWEDDRMLHLFWVTRRTGIRHAALRLSEPDKGFLSPDTIEAGGEVVHFVPYLDRSIPAETLRSLYLGDDDSGGGTGTPGIMVWCVTQRPEGLSCVQIDAAGGGPPSREYPIRVKKAKGLTVVASAVTNGHGLALLLKDGRDRLWYGSTMRGAAVPVDAVAKEKAGLGGSPDIVASRTGPWVYLQYVKDGKALEYIRLEPEDEPDPVETSGQGR